MEDEKKQVKWYHRPVTIVIAILAVGPFALPLIWMSPALKRWHKVVVTIAVLAITVWLFKASADIVTRLMKDIAELQKTM